MDNYTIWTSGYSMNGSSEGASLVGTIDADSFMEACKKLLIFKKYDMSYYNEIDNTYWGCGLYNNETEARRTFG